MGVNDLGVVAATVEEDRFRHPPEEVAQFPEKAELDRLVVLRTDARVGVSTERIGQVVLGLPPVELRRRFGDDRDDFRPAVPELDRKSVV